MSSTATKNTTSKAGAGAQKQIALLGCGKMGGILLQAFLDRKLVGAEEVAATVQHEEKSRSLSGNLKDIALGTDNRAAVAGARVVLLCVKPHPLPHVLEDTSSSLDSRAFVLSTTASPTRALIQ